MSRNAGSVPTLATGMTVSAPPQIPKAERNQSLDVLRAFAVVAVLGYHLDYYPLWTRAGWIGVDLFFVLSGFLISGLLFQEYKDTSKINIRRFLLRRGLKIWPSYYLLLIGVTLIYLLTRPEELRTLKTQLLMNFLVIQNYLPGKVYMILGHTWTLAVEEHFYLMLPILFAFLINWRQTENPFRSIPKLCLAVAVICLALRVLTLKPAQLASATHMRVDGLFGGVALGYLYHFKAKWFNSLTGNYALALALVLITPAVLLDQSDNLMQTFGLTSLALGFVFLVAWAVVRIPDNRILRALLGGIARIGFYSYSIYLWHTVIVVLFLLHAPITFLWFWLYIASCIVGGIAMAHLIEIPYLRLRERILPVAGPRIGADCGRSSRKSLGV